MLPCVFFFMKRSGQGSPNKWNKQEATSVVWCLTRMNCMTDTHGEHPGFPGHAALALRSAGVRAPLELSPPTDPRKPINFKHWLIIGGGGGNCKSNGPSFWMECPLFLSRLTKAWFPFLLSLKCVLSPFFPCIYPVIVMEDILPCGWRDQDATVQEEMSKRCDMLYTFIMCVCVCGMLECQLTNTHTMIEAAALRVQWDSL